LVAGDSTKLRAQNSKKNNFNPNKIERHIAYMMRLDEYNATFSQRRRRVHETKSSKEDKKNVYKNKKGIKIQLDYWLLLYLDISR
jgi:hypothetical protein